MPEKQNFIADLYQGIIGEWAKKQDLTVHTSFAAVEFPDPDDKTRTFKMKNGLVLSSGKLVLGVVMGKLVEKNTRPLLEILQYGCFYGSARVGLYSLTDLGILVRKNVFPGWCNGDFSHNLQTGVILESGRLVPKGFTVQNSLEAIEETLMQAKHLRCKFAYCS